jgi:hypothetical protein
MNKLYLLSLLLVFGCNSKQNSQSESVQDSVSAVAPIDTKDVLGGAKVENVKDTSLVYLITKPGAVNFDPDTARTSEERKKMSEEDWGTVIDDVMYYNSEASQTLEKNGIGIENISDARRYLKFVKTDGGEYTIDRKKVEGMTVFVLFNGVDDPVLLDVMNTEAMVKDLFKK